MGGSATGPAPARTPAWLRPGRSRSATRWRWHPP